MFRTFALMLVLWILAGSVVQAGEQVVIELIEPISESRWPLDDQQVTERYELPEQFVLGLSTLQPRKNFEGLVKAFRQLLADTCDKEGLSDLHLVICGGSGWMHEGIDELVRSYGLHDRVHFPGYVLDDDLPALYSLADVFAFPSWYEGFGLPVLEAMACGTPVVAADNSSLPEVVGRGGLMTNAGDHHALADALALVLTGPDLRASLVTAGRAQAARFSWSEAAQRLLDIYRRFAQRR